METTLQYNGISISRAAKTAGILYVATMATSMIAEVVCFSPLIISGDPASTAQNIMANNLQYRLGVVLMLFTALAAVPLFWGLYVILKDYNRDLALLVVFFRLTETALMCGALLHHITSLRYLWASRNILMLSRQHNGKHLAICPSIPTDRQFISDSWALVADRPYLLGCFTNRSISRFIGARGIFASLLIGLS